MADIVAAMSAVHSPLMISTPQMADESTWSRINKGFDTLRSTFTEAGADTILVISDEHFNALDPRRYPSFGVVTAETGTGPVENWLGIPSNSVTVEFESELAEAILSTGLGDGFDLTRIEEAG